MDLAGKTALVTGGAVRIGRALCTRLGGAGCNVVVHYGRSAEAASELVATLRAGGVAAHAVQGDLACSEDWRRVMEQAKAKAGSLEILINNAAVFHKDGLLDASVERLLAELRINFLAPVMLMGAFAEGVARVGAEGHGPVAKVINLLDRRIVGTDTSCVPYSLSKKMLAAVTVTAARELAPAVAVNGIAPGPILPPPGKGEEYIRDQAGVVPLQRRCGPADIADAALFLLRADAVTGQVIFVDGGQHLLDRNP
jgi:NAD(P)-dependent dehydrogenase (short-subunit alcohol dehydrogenase family)